ncbi:helix-turn-helix transcriptional regulator [Morganella morganii]|nr:WYL domain-containing protein [Morganella morganii]MCU6209750.1 WYL domain-containing protein [Morganella morganii]MCU6225943.1 WYL domain-containing protein [Morganella morganii]MCU6235112.1 WYL domain-containing protein [Morganella morganii]MCU6273803.1 WYL domain-containing protein [Morganella morganii]HAT1515621.1 WYL domain-containing protein [Morganella morganii]
MFQINRKYDRMAVRLSALIARLMAGESLVLSCLAQEFNVSERTLQRDLRERLAYLGVEGRQGCYRLPINTLKAYRDKDVLTFVKQIGMTRLFSGLDSRLLGLLLTQQPHAPCLIWHHAHKISALHADHFYQLVYAITNKQSISLLTPERRFNPLQPYQLIYREGQWYLLAEYHQQVHVLLLEDIQQVQPLNTPFTPKHAVMQLSQQNSFIAALPHFRLISQVLTSLPSHKERSRL